MVNLSAFFSPIFYASSAIKLHFFRFGQTIAAAIGRSIMFVFRQESLPKDPVFPADLKQLGYFINDKDEIRMVADPEQGFLFKINANDRYNEMQKEAMNTCIRDIVSSRLHRLGLETLRLPIGASHHSQHVPILASPSLDTHSRIIVVFGEPVQDLGIWAYRVAGRESINVGSAVNFATAVLREDKHAAGDDAAKSGPGLILTNPGQLVWHCAKERAISLPTWHAIPRRYAVEPPMKMTIRNRIPGNETWQDHVTYVFEEVLSNLVSQDAKVDIIGLAEGGIAAVRYLAEHWPKWQPRISAIALSNPLHDVNHLHPPEFAHFISTRCRAYLVSDKPLDHPVGGRYEHGCNCYSSGESQNVECIMPRAWPSMLKWLNSMHEKPALEEVEMILGDAADEIADMVRNGAEVTEG